MKAYFMDTGIYLKGSRQAPRKVYCYGLNIKKGIAHFRDRDGDTYSLPKDRIMYESESSFLNAKI